jgi:hypothetical protein
MSAAAHELIAAIRDLDVLLRHRALSISRSDSVLKWGRSPTSGDIATAAFALNAAAAGKREPAMRKRHPPTRRHANRRVTHWLSGVRVLVSAQRFGEIALEDRQASRPFSE